MAQSPPTTSVSRRVWTVPNVLSMVRLVCIPLFLIAVATSHYDAAFGVLFISGISDYLDGKIARSYGLVTRLGQLLDPVADRLSIAATVGAMTWCGLIPWWLFAVLLARETFMAALVAYARTKGQIGLPVHFVGKAATFNLMCGFPLILLGTPSSGWRVGVMICGWAFIWWGTVLYWISAMLYVIQLNVGLKHEATA